MPRTMKKKSSRRPRRMHRKRRVYRKYNRGNHVKDVASGQFTTLVQLLQPSQALSGGVYAFRNFSLANASDRIQRLGQSFQQYRIKKVTWQVKPFFDTYPAATTATAPTVPHLYWMIDRLAAYDADTTLTTLKAAGAKPIRLDDKMITKSFKPSVMYPTVYAPSNEDGTANVVASAYRISPWLSTNQSSYGGTKQTAWDPSSVDHQGLLIGIDCDIIPFSSTATIQFTVEFEFRKPLDDLGGTGEAVVQEVDLLDLKPKFVPPPPKPAEPVV